MHCRRYFTALVVIAVGYLSQIAQADVPELAKIKAAAEAGNPEAQYVFAKSFGAGGSDWKRWMGAAAAQGYGPAEDDLAWTSNWAIFATSHSDPKTKAYVVKNNGAQMRQALILASSAADKGFHHSRLLLAYAYKEGYMVTVDRVEAYKWVLLAGGDELLAGISTSSVKNELVKSMSMTEVKEGEARAENYRPGETAILIRNAMIVPRLKLAGIASSGGERVAILNGTKISSGQNAQLRIDGLTVEIHCVSIDDKEATVTLPPDDTPITLRTGSMRGISQ